MNTFWKTLMTFWFGTQYKITDGTVSFTAVEEGKVTVQDFSHQQSSQITRNICYRLIRTGRRTCSRWWEWNICHSGSICVMFGCISGNKGIYNWLKYPFHSDCLWNCSCNGHSLSCPSSTHALGVVQWKMEYKIPRKYHCMFWGYWCIDCMFWGYWCYPGAEHHTYHWEKWVTHWEIRHPDVRRKELPRSHQCSQERDVHQLIWGNLKESSDKGSSTRKHCQPLLQVCHI